MIRISAVKREARKTHHFVDGIEFELENKRVKNLNLRVRRDGTVHVSAPAHVPLAEVERFVRSRATWIARARERQQGRQESVPQLWREPERVRLWGEEYPLLLEEAPSVRSESVELRQGSLVLSVASRYLDDSERSVAHRENVAQRWLRERLDDEISALLAHHEPLMGVHATDIRLRSMRSRWGSCNVKTGAITLNSSLVHHPRRCLEYVVVHELCHLLEPSHNARFHSLMDRFYPNWRAVRTELRG